MMPSKGAFTVFVIQTFPAAIAQIGFGHGNVAAAAAMALFQRVQIGHLRLVTRA